MEGNLSTAYKKQIKLLFTQLTAIGNWHFSGKVGKFNISTSGPYVKLECILDIECTMLTTALSDTSAITREQWDSRTHTLVRLCMFESNVELINWEHSLRIQYRRTSENENLILQSTAMHPVYKSAPNAQHNDCLFLLKRAGDRTHLTYIGLLDISPTILECELAVPRLRGIYDTWKCLNCAHSGIPPHELECRNCKLERYRRCPDKRCFEPQKKDATKCELCKILL